MQKKVTDSDQKGNEQNEFRTLNWNYCTILNVFRYDIGLVDVFLMCPTFCKLAAGAMPLFVELLLTNVRHVEAAVNSSAGTTVRRHVPSLREIFLPSYSVLVASILCKSIF